MSTRPPEVVFCATGRSGLGHLRRVTNIARALHERRPDLGLRLVSNADPAGLGEEELALYRRIDQVPREQMAGSLAGHRGGPVVVDTASLPGLGRVEAPIALVLRETMADKLSRFEPGEGRPWDLVLLPNPEDDWQPPEGCPPARRRHAVGWIYRSLPAPEGRAVGAAREPRRVLVASGGGGTRDTAATLRREIDDLLERCASLTAVPFEVVQALGPRAGEGARLNAAARVVDPGPRLNALFADADVVVSTAGYNSVLEIAALDVPTLLVPIARSIDDQLARARRWGGRVGACHEPGAVEASAWWLAQTLSAGARRAPVALGPSGAARAAELLLELA